MLHTIMPTELCITYKRVVSVHPHHVNHHVKTFHALLRDNLHHFSQRCVSSSNFFIQSLQMSDAFTNLHFSTII